MAAEARSTSPERAWRRFEACLETLPDGDASGLVERALTRTRPGSLVWRAAGLRHPAVRELAGGLAWHAALEEAGRARSADERRRRRSLLATALEGARSRPDSALARALAVSLGERGFDDEWLSQALAAAADEESIGTYATRGELAGHALARSGRTLRALLRALDDRSERGAREADAAQTARVLARDLRALPRHLERGQLYLPFDRMQAFGVRTQDLHAPKPTEPLRALVTEQIGWIRGLVAKLERRPKRLLTPAGVVLRLHAARTEQALRWLALRGFERRARRKSGGEGAAWEG